MSRGTVADVVQRALSDDEFRSLLSERPYDALEGYDLEPNEQGALVAASEEDLTSMGIGEEQARQFVSLFHISRGGGGV